MGLPQTLARRDRHLAKLGRCMLRPRKSHRESLCASRLSESVPCFALLAGRFKFVAGLPAGQSWLRSRFLSERETKSRDLGKPREIHLGAILVAGLMIIMIDVIFRL